jgi:hypothetical protein
MVNHFQPEVNPQRVVGRLTYWTVRGSETLYVVVFRHAHAKTLFVDAPSLDIYFLVGENRIITRRRGVSHFTKYKPSKTLYGAPLAPGRSERLI